MKKRLFEALIFDWDGTLMDSPGRIVACMQAAAAEAELPVPAAEDVRNVIGLGLPEALATVFPAVEPAAMERLVSAYRHYYLYASDVPAGLFPGARELLEELRHAGYWLAVATGKGRQGLDRALAETGCGELFHTSRCADETFSKPHPQMVWDILDQFGVEPQAALVLGDTEYDMQMARNAGTASLAVSYGAHPRERLLSHEPLTCVASLAELQTWFRTVSAEPTTGAQSPMLIINEANE